MNKRFPKCLNTSKVNTFDIVFQTVNGDGMFFCLENNLLDDCLDDYMVDNKLTTNFVTLLIVYMPKTLPAMLTEALVKFRSKSISEPTNEDHVEVIKPTTSTRIELLEARVEYLEAYVKHEFAKLANINNTIEEARKEGDYLLLNQFRVSFKELTDAGASHMQDAFVELMKQVFDHDILSKYRFLRELPTSMQDAIAQLLRK